jgi:hypothetical protein
MRTFLVGDRVGAGRIPYHGAHPTCGKRPWAGTVLAIDDPKAWAGSIAFPTRRPRQADVTAHVRQCQEQGLLGDKIPVLWDFGKVYWERPSVLRTVAEDLAAFETERQAALGSNSSKAA